MKHVKKVKMLKKEKPLLLIIIFLLAVSLGSIERTYAQTTTLSIKPSEVIIEPDQEFTVDVNITDVQNMYAYEFKIYYKNSVLNATKAVRPPGHFMEPSDPVYQFIPKWEIKNNYNATHGRIWLAFTLLAPEPAKSGSGILAKITFKAIGEGSTLLSLKDTKLADKTGAPIPHVPENCYVTVKLPEIPQPTLEVDPKIASPTHRGETIPVNITIKDLDERWRAVGFEFKLGYDNQLLKVVNVIEGPFLKQFGETYMVPPVIKPNYVLFGLLLLPHEDGVWTVYPNGSGTLATILFEVIHGPPASTNLTLYDTKIADITATPPGVPHTAVSGEYKFIVEILLSTITWTDPTTNQTHTFQIQTESNSTIGDITFLQLHRCLTFTLTGPEGTIGFLNITIPRKLLDAKPDEWLILIDGKPITYTAAQNTTHTCIYFTYTTSTKIVYIFSVNVIPEFPESTILLALLLATATAISTRKLFKPKKNAKVNSK